MAILSQKTLQTHYFSAAVKLANGQSSPLAPYFLGTLYVPPFGLLLGQPQMFLGKFSDWDFQSSSLSTNLALGAIQSLCSLS